MRTRVFVVDDHDLVIEGLQAALGAEADLEVVGAAQRADDALERIGAVRPDVVVLDHRLGDADGAGVCREIAESGTGAQVVMLSAYPEQEAVQAARRAGACAYVSKEDGMGALCAAVRGAARGQSDAGIGTRQRSEGIPLRATERALLRLLAQGLTNAQIAAATGLTRETVKTYLRDLYLKLDVKNRAQAAAVALRGKMI